MGACSPERSVAGGDRCALPEVAEMVVQSKPDGLDVQVAVIECDVLPSDDGRIKVEMGRVTSKAHVKILNLPAPSLGYQRLKTEADRPAPSGATAVSKRGVPQCSVANGQGNRSVDAVKEFEAGPGHAACHIEQPAPH